MRTRREECRRGAVLLEFALTAFVLYLLIAGGVELGRMIFVSQTLHDAARVAARELALTPLPAAICLADPGPSQPNARQACVGGATTQNGCPVQFGALTYQSLDPANNCQPDGRVDVRATVWDPGKLVIDLDYMKSQSGCTPSDPNVSSCYDAFQQQNVVQRWLPLVNKALYPLFTFETVTVDGCTRNLLRYPGALLKIPNSGWTGCPAAPAVSGDYSGGLMVGVPSVTPDPGTGKAIGIQWLAILSEVGHDPIKPGLSAFDFTAQQCAQTVPTGCVKTPGVAQIVINYPFQSAALSAFKFPKAAELASDSGNLADRIDADEGGIGGNVTNPDNAIPSGATAASPTCDPQNDPTCSPGTYSGTYGLGTQLAVNEVVRPYRKVLVGEALFRREVIQ